MAKERIVDLDALVPDDLTVKLNGEKYKVPADLDTKTVAKAIAIGNKLQDEPTEEAIHEFEHFISELLAMRQEPPKELKITLTQAIGLIRAVTGTAQKLAKDAVPFVG